MAGVVGGGATSHAGFLGVRKGWDGRGAPAGHLFVAGGASARGGSLGEGLCGRLARMGWHWVGDGCRSGYAAVQLPRRCMSAPAAVVGGIYPEGTSKRHDEQGNPYRLEPLRSDCSWQARRTCRECEIRVDL